MASQDLEAALELQQQLEHEAASESLYSRKWDCANAKCKEKNPMTDRWCKKCKMIWCCDIWYVWQKIDCNLLNNTGLNVLILIYKQCIALM